LNLLAQTATIGRPRISFIKMLEGFRGLEQVNIKRDAITAALAGFENHCGGWFELG
jgi:hypothetical protein